MSKNTFGGTYYHIFVPSFCDSNGDGIGDIPGIISRLDYLWTLGIEGIWLSPIHPSASYHKYDIDDFYSVAPEFGTLEDYQQLLDESHKRGIKVLLDLVQNCPSARHPAFRKALEDPYSPEASWFWFRDATDTKELSDNLLWMGLPSWQTAENGRQYIGIYDAVMPDFNLTCKNLRAELKNIAAFWLRLGVDGFRLDSAMHLFSTSEVPDGVSHHALNIEWFQEFGRFCRKIKPDCFLVGEVWIESSTRALYYKGLDSTFHFGLGSDIADMLKGNISRNLFIARYDSAERCARLVSASYTDAPFLSNHDMLRFSEETGFDETLLKLSAAIYLTLPGRPFVYYGEELGLRAAPDDWCDGFRKDDLFIRSRTAFPFPEGEPSSIHFHKSYLSPSFQEQENNKSSLLWFYRNLIQLRKKESSLRNGKLIFSDIDNRVLAYYRNYVGRKTLVLHNLTNESFTLAVPTATEFIDLMTEGGSKNSFVNNRLTMLPFHSIVVYF